MARRLALLFPFLLAGCRGASVTPVASLGGTLPLGLRFDARGRLLVANPDVGLQALDVHTGKATLLTGLYFPNGVAVTSDQKSVLVAQTGLYAITRYRLADGMSEPFATNMPGIPDGVMGDGHGTIWVACMTARGASWAWWTCAEAPRPRGADRLVCPPWRVGVECGMGWGKKTRSA